MANNSYISKVNLPDDPTTYYIKDEEARDSLLQLQNEFVSKDGDTIDGTLNVTDVNAGTLLVTGNASFVNGLYGDLDGNATTATLAATATEANHAATATTATSATSAEKIRINNEDINVGDYLTPTYFLDGVPTQSAGKTIPLINGTGTTAGTWLGSLTGLTAYSDGLLILYKIPIAGASTTTLNINNIGAKTVYWNNASKLTTHFPVNQIIMLVYCASLNSGSWVCVDTYNSDADHYTTPWCNTSASTAAKVASCNGYVLRQNQVFPVLMATTNTSQSLLTLNINGTGAKNIYINGTISSSSNYTLPAGIYFVYYNGTNYYFRTDNLIDTSISGNAATATLATKATKLQDSKTSTTEITVTKTAQSSPTAVATWNNNEIGSYAISDLQSQIDTHYTTHIYAGSGTSSNSTSDVTDPKIAVADNTTVASTNGYIQLKGDGLTDVKAKNGIVTINTPTSHDHTTDDIVPIQTMTYTGILGTADNSADSDSFYFMRMRPKTFYDQWMLHYRVTAFIPNQINYRTTSDVILYGYGQASAPAMKIFNTIYSTSYRPIYYNNFYRLNSTGYNGNCYNAVGVGLNGSNARNSAGYERTIVVELLETYNCTAELLNSVVKWANWESASSNYAGLSQFDACTNGLQETSDNNDVTTQRFSYSHLTAGENGIKMYSLVMMDSIGKWQSFTTGTGGIANTKAKNTTGFVPGMIYYVNRNSDLDPNGVTADNQLHRHINLVDLRYSTNCGQTLTANKMVYIVGTMSNGLFYLDNTWWTQTEPTEADGKVYIPIGITYDKYRADLLNWQGMYYHNGTNFVPYYEATASSHAISSDLLEFQSAIPTNASQVGNAGTITGLTVSKIGSISDFATTDVYAPASNAGMLLNMGYSDTYGHQVFVDDSSNMLAHRYNNNGTWQNWQQILDTSTFPISIENGGTNATTIQDAANNLQVVSLGQGIPITTTQNTNIDNIVAIGNYYCSSNSYVSSLGGTLPSGLGNNAFTLKVGYSTGTGFKYQELRQYNNGRTWYRIKGGNLDSADWGSWNPYYQLSSIALTGDTTGTATSNVGAWSIATTTTQISTVGDKRNEATTPNDYKNKIIFQGLKRNATIDNPSSNPYSYLIGLRGWSDSSGGNSHEVAFNNTGIFRRSGDTTSWGNWLKILDSSNYTDYTVTKTGGGASGDWNINAATATKFSSTQTIELTGDITGSDIKDGSSGWSIETSLANSGVTSGSYGQSTDTSPDYNGTFNVPYFTVDTKGRITSASTKTVTLPVWKNVYDKIIDANFATNYRTQTKGNTNSGWYISAIRNNTANVANSPQHGSGLGWGVSDTHGYLYTDYRANNPGVYVGGGNANKLNWIKALAFADGTNASGTWGISITGNATTATSATSAGSATTATKFSSDRTIALTGDVTGSASDDGTNGWNIATTANRLTSLGRYAASLNDIDFSNGNYKGKIVFLHADGNTLYKPNYGTDGAGGGTNGSVINIGWDNLSTATDNKYGAQIMLTNGTTTGSGTGATQMYIRGRHTNNNWDEWRKVLDEGNYTDYTVTKTGTGATGTWAIDISGNATTATSAGSATNDANGDAIDSTYAKLGGATFTGQVYGNMINVNASKTKTTGGLGLYGNSSGLNYSIMMRGTDTTSDGLGTHGYVTGDWATYFNQAGISTHLDDRGWIFRSGLQSSKGLIPVASISGAGNAVFNGSVTVGGNAANTSGVELIVDETTNSLNFVWK